MARIQGPNGQVAQVDDENRLQTFSVIQHEDKNAAVGGCAWSIFASITPALANDKFFYFKNTGTKDLFITDVRASSSAVTQLLYKQVTGIAVGGSDAEITNRKLGDPTTPNAIIQESTGFTGLADGGTIFFEECHEVNRRENIKTTSNIIIPQGQAIAFERVAATGLITMVISLIEAES